MREEASSMSPAGGLVHATRLGSGDATPILIRAGIPDARVVVFEHSGQVSHLEEPDACPAAVRDFLR
jgi:hypothetical protein